jgi:transposase-like protein
MEMVVNGVSTRKVTHITEELCGESFSKSTVSALCAALESHGCGRSMNGGWRAESIRS